MGSNSHQFRRQCSCSWDSLIFFVHPGFRKKNERHANLLNMDIVFGVTMGCAYPRQRHSWKNFAQIGIVNRAQWGRHFPTKSVLIFTWVLACSFACWNSWRRLRLHRIAPFQLCSMFALKPGVTVWYHFTSKTNNRSAAKCKRHQRVV